MTIRPTALVSLIGLLLWAAAGASAAAEHDGKAEPAAASAGTAGKAKPAAAAPTTWFRELEITDEPAPRGQRDYSVRFTPAKTHECTRILFECIYHQEFPYSNPEGKRLTKIHEPVRFPYTRHAVKMVNALDQQISFRVPLSMDHLQNMYGEKTFNKAYPVTVERMRITAFAGEEMLWTYLIKAGGLHDAADLAAAVAADTTKPQVEESLEDLDVDLLAPVPQK